MSTFPDATNATAYVPRIRTLPIENELAMNVRIEVPLCVTSTELTLIVSPPASLITPASVSIVAPDGIVIAGSLEEAANAVPKPFDGSKVRQRVPSGAHPSEHDVDVAAFPFESQVVN